MSLSVCNNTDIKNPNGSVYRQSHDPVTYEAHNCPVCAAVTEANEYQNTIDTLRKVAHEAVAQLDVLSVNVESLDAALEAVGYERKRPVSA